MDFDLNNTLGFTSSDQIPVNTYGTQNSNDLAPLFTGFNMDIRSLPNITVPPNLQFPLAQPSNYSEQIQSSINSNLTAPKNYVWNLTLERQLPKQGVLTFSYIGRYAQNLLAQQDVTAFNDIIDPPEPHGLVHRGNDVRETEAEGHRDQPDCADSFL